MFSNILRGFRKVCKKHFSFVLCFVVLVEKSKLVAVPHMLVVVSYYLSYLGILNLSLSESLCLIRYSFKKEILVTC